MNMLTIPASLDDRIRCPHCQSSRFKIVDYIIEQTILDTFGKPINDIEFSDSYAECLCCHCKYPHTGNGLDGYFIDDGTGIHEPEFEKHDVVFNPFYRYNDYIGVI